MSDCDSEHSAESVGSNSSQSQSKKKHTSGKRKRTTATSCSTSSAIMVHPACPVQHNYKYGKVVTFFLMDRIRDPREQEKHEIASRKGKFYWEYVTSMINEDEFSLTVEDVVKIIREIQDFHKINYCDCCGKVLCSNAIDKGPPTLPSPQELIEWKKISSKSDTTCETSSRKRMCTYDVGKSLELTQDKMYDSLSRSPHAVTLSRGEELVKIYNHFNLPREIKGGMLISLTNSPELIPMILNQGEEELVEWFRVLASPDVYQKWRKEWDLRKQS